MKPAIATCFILIILEVIATGSSEKSSHNGESGELCSLLNKLLQVKDQTITKEMKILLKALFEAFSHCNLTETPATDVIPTSAATSPAQKLNIQTNILQTTPSATESTPATSIAASSTRHSSDQKPGTNEINHLTTAITTTSPITVSTTPPPSNQKPGTNEISHLTTAITTTSPITVSTTPPPSNQKPRTNEINHLTTAITTTSPITVSTTPPPSSPVSVSASPDISKRKEETLEHSKSGPVSVSASPDISKRKEGTPGHSKSGPVSVSASPDISKRKEETLEHSKSGPVSVSASPDISKRKEETPGHSQSGPVSVSASPDISKRKEETPGHSKSDLKFLWIILGVLSVLTLGTILILKSKVLICTRIHTNADVADYMEEKMYSKNDDIILLGVTPGIEVEDECYLPRKGSAGYEAISSKSGY